MRLSSFLSVQLLFLCIDLCHGFTCGENNTLCEVCKKFSETEGVHTYFAAEQCSIYAGVQDETGNYTIPERCELLFSKIHPTSCQLAVISDVDLLGYYIQYGIRMQDHSMLLSLEREGCSSKWNWWSRLENKTTTAGMGDATEPCDVVQGAFVGFNLVRINPANFTPTGILCQCSNQVSFLPVVKKPDNATSVSILLAMTVTLGIQWFK
ncbi:hypothetical protein GCK72_025410 [Caenorhabditis remanei]|uniref:Uncharacterized protein n=1 Tax=Caenorhabditis remanei TaxID=31234 RepID=A0A6A5G2C1_CAERE|nr:hypothetical protein GCK72_025410 [Caenorhabditis remanei]KAF1748943.1 hypothetical protein GCK72_025410 [Caenorhabditis remanei]